MKTLSRIIVALAVFLFGVQITYAQDVKFGVKAGADFSRWGGDDVKNIDISTNIGYHAGAFAEFPLTNIVNLESGLYVSRKGFKSKEEVLGSTLKLTNTSTYLDLPVMAKFMIARNYNISLGPQLSYLLQNKTIAKWEGEKDTQRKVTGFKKFDLGAVAGIGYQFNNGLLFSANYDFGLTKMDDVTSMKAYNRVVKASIGYRF